MKFYNFGIPFIGHSYYTISLSDLHSAVEKIGDPKKIKHFHYMTCNGHTLV